jgi:hypothetical protein
MDIKVMGEAGFKEALQGLALSYNSYSSKRVADKLAFKGGGHNKFLESMQVWLDITAPRYWWQQFDTYRVGTSKQSESTMHTLLRGGDITQDRFEGGIHEGFLDSLNYWKDQGDLDTIKKHLPESFLQRRIVSTNYRVLQNMESQRRSHKLSEWQLFLDAVWCQVEHPEYLIEEKQ